jgi:hypothetical protein
VAGSHRDPRQKIRFGVLTLGGRLSRLRASWGPCWPQYWVNLSPQPFHRRSNSLDIRHQYIPEPADTGSSGAIIELGSVEGSPNNAFRIDDRLWYSGVRYNLSYWSMNDSHSANTPHRPPHDVMPRKNCFLIDSLPRGSFLPQGNRPASLISPKAPAAGRSMTALSTDALGGVGACFVGFSGQGLCQQKSMIDPDVEFGNEV